MKIKLSVLLLSLLVLSLAQNQCEQSRLYEIQTGQIALNPNDLGSAGANKNYYESLSRGNFQQGDRLGYAFALTGFETSCSQSYYSLLVDVVQFQNGNTKMRIVVDFRNPNEDILTTWSKVKLSYLVVSASRAEGPSDEAYIWATTTQYDLTGGSLSNSPFMNDDIFDTPSSSSGCGLTYDAVTGYNLGIQCDNTPANGLVNQDISLHTYIMGFQFNPDTNTNNGFLGVELIFDSLTNTLKELINGGGDRTGANYPISITYAATSNGPAMSIDNFGGQLETIKIGMVFTVVMGQQGTPIDNGLGSTLSYSYSGVYTQVVGNDYNIQSVIDSANDFNNLHERLPTTKYMIYGFSSFRLNDNSGCSSFNIDLQIDTPSSYLLHVNNIDYVQDITFQADIYTVSLNSLCNPQVIFTDLIHSSTQLTNAVNGNYDNLIYMQSRKSQQYTTVPSNSVDQFINQIDDNPLNLDFVVNGIDQDQTRVRLEAQVTMSGITNGKPYGVRLQMRPSSTPTADTYHTPTDNGAYQFKVMVNGFTIYNQNYNQTDLQAVTAPASIDEKFYGLNLNGNEAIFKYQLIIPRNPNVGVSYKFSFFVDLFEFNEVYDPVTQCCVSQCPDQTGLDVTVAPATCTKCDVAKGLKYNAASGSCDCEEGFYLNNLLHSQCFPCESQLCATCNPNQPDKCLTCKSGATFSTLDSSCTCSEGFYFMNSSCITCPHRCATCAVGTSCQTCSDPVNRDINNNCSCVAGFYDSGIDQCQTCNPNCATCSDISTCTSCDPRKFRTLKGNVCVCQDGFYELIHQNGTRECKPCSGECNTCTSSAVECTSCDSSINRVEGYDSLGHRTCICRPGYYALDDFSCVQSDCNADPYCSQCQKDLALCIQCRASVNRVIKLPEHICICKDGYYEHSNGTCVPCGNGCAKCTSATQCTACVAQATPNGNGTCTCAVGTYFLTTTNDVRYCHSCPEYCDKCNNPLTCQQCQNNFVLATDNTCVCPRRNFINAAGNCVPCKTGCETCDSTTTCQKCVAPLVLEKNNCVVKCSEGFYLDGAICRGCPDNCVACTSTNQCFYCQDNFFLHAGICLSVCPPGTVADKMSFKCVPCNSPCRTCANHPSQCTSCEPGQGYLQISESSQSCVKQCPEGTFPSNNVCQVCNFKCAKCLGAANNCIACPVDRYLYNGACWDYCPGIMVKGQCIDSCPVGYYRFSDQQCRECNKECQTCSNNASCLTCTNGYISKDGKCVNDCGDGYYEFRGLCVACDKSCNKCQRIPTQCSQCAKGYVRSGSKCVISCSSNQYLDSTSGQCKRCSSQCDTCSSENNCLTCPNSSIQPIGGKCLNCIYPCNTCSNDLSVCNSCLSGFYLSAGQCVSNCPTGTRPVNGVCSCSSGIFFNSTCVQSCPSGYTRVNNTCQRCQSPCIECAGSTNFCTDCLDTFTLKPQNGQCQQTSQCNYGQEQINDKCERICEQGSYYQNGACIFGGCPNTFKDNGFGGCVPTSTQTGVCLSPTFKLNNVCVEDCGNGFYPNINTRTCQQCSSNCQNCLTKNYCLSCANGYASIDGKCVQQSNCPSTQFNFGGKCVAVCPNGTFTNNGRCVRSCPVGAFYYASVCYRTCPADAQYKTQNACVATCPNGTKLIDGVCATIV